MKYPLEKSATQWKEELGEEKYRVLREKTERPHSGTYNYTMKKALIVVALVQNHYLKVIQSLMHTVAGLLLTIPGKLNMS
jgi:peptide methionine sulfoxide reductase MsrB